MQVKAGSLLNVVGLFIVMASVYTMGEPSFDVFNNCPDWLNSAWCLTQSNGSETTTIINNLINSTNAIL